MHIKLALDAGGDGGQNNASLALEALRAAIYEWLNVVRILRIFGNGHEHGVNPTSRLDAVESTDNKLKLLVKVLIKVLDATIVGGDADTLDTLFHKLCCDLGFVLADIRLTEEELPVQVGDVDGV